MRVITALFNSVMKLVVLNMVDDIVVVDTPDALFITRSGASKKERKAVKYLKDKGMTDRI